MIPAASPLRREVGTMDSCGATVLTVTQVNARARQMLERQFASVLVGGEVSNIRVDASGHRWLCLKDTGGVLNAVLFRREAQALGFALKDGVQVIASGRLTIYGPSGRYQLVIAQLMPQGAGALQAAFEALKVKLQAEGLFEQARKRPLPWVPRCVAVISSPTGAVLRDIVQVSSRRFPNAQILLLPVRVQGAECAQQLVQAIERVGQIAAARRLDTLIVARGGGSLEDLGGFNDERVARAIAACPIPVVSAVGHETDFTMADFVADVRAPTPSAAAELVFPQKSELLFTLQRLLARCGQALRRDLQRQRLRLRALRAELGDGRAPLLVQAQRLAMLQRRLAQRLRSLTTAQRRRLHTALQRLNALHPRLRLQRVALRLRTATAQLQRLSGRAVGERRRQLLQLAPAVLALAQRRHIARDRLRLGALAGRLHALSPLGVLSRGYSIVLTDGGAAVRHTAQVGSGDRLDIRVGDGQLWAKVE